MAAQRHADIILANARILTLDTQRPRASCLAVKDGEFAGVGDAEILGAFRGPGTQEMDCQGMTLAPGFNDAHCHLMALASSLRGVDCRPDKAKTIAHVIGAIRKRAESVPPGKWIRAFGYDESYFDGNNAGRHPTRWDLDRAASHHPVRLDHRTGHASALNSRALELLGITADTPDPVDGVIERDEATGEPTGVLYEMGEYISGRMAAHRDQGDLWDGLWNRMRDGIDRANRLLLSRGITSIQDASPGNDYPRWRAFHKLKEERLLIPRTTVMAGASHLQSFLDTVQDAELPDAGWASGWDSAPAPDWGDDTLRLGAVKLMLGLTTGTLQPDREELHRIVREVHDMGFQLAIHAVEEEAIEAAVSALAGAQAASPRPRGLKSARHKPARHRPTRHRIEHCSECPPSIVEKLKAVGALVVTNPGFIYHNGEKYRSLVEERLLPHLYPAGSLARAGVPVAAGSDAPVIHPDPLLDIYAAVTRRTSGGNVLSPAQAVSAGAALRMHTINSASASFEEKRKGSIAVGKLADLALLDSDPTAVDPEGIKEIRVMMTMVGGKVVWEGR